VQDCSIGAGDREENPPPATCAPDTLTEWGQAWAAGQKNLTPTIPKVDRGLADTGPR
jgi:hypothetical protein